MFGGELSLTTCRGSEDELARAETVLQTPNRPEEEYFSDPEYERIEEKGNMDSAVAYRTRSHDTEEILDNLRTQLKSDIYFEEGKISTFKKATKNDSGVFVYEDREGDYSVILEEINVTKEEAKIENKKKLKGAIEMLNTSMGAVAQVIATSEQEKILDNFSKAMDSLGDKEVSYSKIDCGGIEDSQDTKTLRNTTFTMGGAEFKILNNTWSSLTVLETINWDELHPIYLVQVIRALIVLCKRDQESQIKDTKIIGRLETGIANMASTHDLLVAMDRTIKNLNVKLEVTKKI